MGPRDRAFVPSRDDEGGHADRIPISDEVEPSLREAIEGFALEARFPAGDAARLSTERYRASGE